MTAISIELWNYKMQICTCLDEVPAIPENCAIRVSCSEMSAIVKTAEVEDYGRGTAQGRQG